MAKLVIGAGYDQSILKLRSRAPANSDVQIIVGDGHHMSVREIDVLFHEEVRLGQELDTLRKQVDALQLQHPGDARTLDVCHHADVIASTAKKMKQEHRWYSISAKGLLDAAAAVGSAADPLVKTAIGIVKLLATLKDAE